MQKLSLYTMAALYLVAGINHFWHPSFYLKIMPTWIKYHEILVNVTGMFEILFALLLLPNRTRHLAGWCIIFLLIAIFPANIQMLQNYLKYNNPQTWAAILRLPFQIVLIWWAYKVGKQSINARQHNDDSFQNI